MTEPKSTAKKTWQDAVRHMIKVVDELPGWMAQADPETIDALTDAVADLEEALADEHASRPVETFDDVLPWLASTPDAEVWCGRVGETSQGYATDGHAMLVIDDVSGVASIDSANARWSREESIGIVRKTAVFAAANEIEIGRGRLFGATEGDRVRIGNTVLDANIVRHWVLPIARLTQGPFTIGWGGAREPVRFSGAGWRAIVMPIAVHEIEAGMPRLDGGMP